MNHGVKNGLEEGKNPRSDFLEEKNPRSDFLEELEFLNCIYLESEITRRLVVEFGSPSAWAHLRLDSNLQASFCRFMRVKC